MKHKKVFPLLLLSLFVLSAFQTVIIVPQQTAQPSSIWLTTPPASTPTPTQKAHTTPGQLADLSIDWSQPFAGELEPGEKLVLKNWMSQPYAGKDLPLPLSGLGQLANPAVVSGLTSQQTDFLIKNGFVAVHSQEAQFGDIRVETASKTGQPYYLTSDAALHALHLLFDDMLKAIEREYFRPNMIAIIQATLTQLGDDLPKTRGTAIEADAVQALAYLSVANKLLDPSASVDPSVADQVNRQVEQIMAGGKSDKLVLFPKITADLGAYKPVGHYAGDEELEAYFRGMTWLGTIHFPLKSKDPAPSRLPLIVTLELRRAQVEDETAASIWASMHETLTYVVGPSDDPGPLEYAALMDQIYGKKATIRDLADATHWSDFQARAGQFQAPQINSLFVKSTQDLIGLTGWRLMGQRFTLDGMIFQNLIYDRVGENSEKKLRDFPSGLDVMAAFGSQLAYQQLDRQGETRYANYPEQMDKMQKAVQERTETQWLARFYDGWLYSFFPLIQDKDSAYPAYMRSPAWGYRSINSALGSWAELKHDTVLYSKMPEFMGEGGPPTSGPAPSYVEPNPTFFYRAGFIAKSLSCGLQNHLVHEPCFDIEASGGSADDAFGQVRAMYAFGKQLEALGDIAAKELAGQPITHEENNLITSCLGLTECINFEYHPNSEMPKVPVIAAVSGALGDVLEAGVGGVDRIYVVVPLEGKWEIAQGGVFSYYEFAQSRDNRLTDEDWRKKLAEGNIQLPTWAKNFLLEGGHPNAALAFRKGDVYIVNEAGDKLNVHDTPSLNGKLVSQLKTGDYIEIIDGPVQADNSTWWKVKTAAAPVEASGWVVENSLWLDRSY
jgi:hypothetical protein